jgi:hypothetical protein
MVVLVDYIDNWTKNRGRANGQGKKPIGKDF